MASEPRFSFIGYPLRDDLADRWPLQAPIREIDPDGVYVHRLHDKPAVPRCKCSHPESKHGEDRRGRLVCFGSPVCGCVSFRLNQESE